MDRLVRLLLDTLGVLVVWDKSIGSWCSTGSDLMTVLIGELSGDTEEEPKSGRRMFSMEKDRLEDELESGDPQDLAETLLSMMSLILCLSWIWL